MQITILETDEQKETQSIYKTYTLPGLRLSDFEQWKDKEEVSFSLSDFATQIEELTQCGQDPFIENVRILLPKNVIENLRRDENLDLFSTAFTKNRKELLAQFSKEIQFGIGLLNGYEVKIEE